MPVSDLELIRAWDQVLRLSGVRSGDMVTILTSDNTHPQTLRCAALSAASCGAVVNRLDLPPINGEKALSRDSLAYLGTTPLTGNRAAMAALKASDFVLDLMTLLFSPEQQELLEAGTRILLAVEPPEVLVRLVPTPEDRERVSAAARIFEGKKAMHVTSRAGTNVRMPLGQYPVVQEYGLVDQPGRWDHWPSGFILTWPNEGEVEGTIVLDRGDILLPMKSYVQSPITITIEKGFATSIEGGLDAELLCEYMASFNDPEAYAISHIGYGLQKRAYWSTLSLYDREATIAMDARAFNGNFLFSMGPNNEVGGTRSTPCHIDIPMRNCSVALDDVFVVREGKVVEALHSASKKVEA
jgi:2,5-dihydroxypyridine 5,6-dioxygenase